LINLKQVPYLSLLRIKCSNKQFMVMVFSGTFNNISVISWLSVLLVDETRVPR